MSSPLFPVRVNRIEQVSPDSWKVFWRRNHDFNPGQVVSVSLHPDEPSRLYSLVSGSDEEDAGLLFNLVEDGLLTPRIKDMHPNDTLFISAPFGSFLGRKGPGVWIANGTGVAPFISMARSGLFAEKTLIHGARIKSNFYDQDLFVELLGSSYVRCSSFEKGPELYSGRLTTYLAERSWPIDQMYSLCGSASMIVEVRDILIEKRVPFENILSEVYF